MTQVTLSTRQAVLQPINGDYRGKDIVSLEQFSVDDLQILFTATQYMKRLVLNNEPSQLLAGQLIALLFFEPSSRTF
jgi:aspartate carbamoyltransferase catalytic subunit